MTLRKHRRAAKRRSTRRSWLRFETLESRTLLASDLWLKSEPLAPAPAMSWPLAAVYAPDTDPKILQLFPDVFSGTPTGGDDRLAPFVFGDTNRWSVTATNGGGLQPGDPTTITWSIVPDGTPINGFNGEPSSPSDLVSFLGNIYGTNTNDANLTDEPWFGLFQSYLERWSELSGISYVYEPSDDGISINAFGSQGVLGVRGDMRISGHFIDGNSNILAYNFFPNSGDMVIDTGDVNFYSSTANNSRALRNVLSHENGHGLGLDHVCPVITGPNGRLMEPFINLSIDGPQFDDILAVHRGYGDVLEKNGGNDSSSTAVPLGPLSTTQAIILGADASDMRVAPTEVDFVSIDDNSDVDFFSFTVGAGMGANIQLTPLGPSYLSGPQNSDGTCSAGTLFNAAAQSDLTLQLIGPNGSTVLGSSNVAGLGGAEQIVSGLLAPGTYYVRVSGDANAAQMYRLNIIGEQVTGILLTESAGQTIVSESGRLDSYTLQLGTASAGSVQVTVSSDGQTQVSSDGVTFANTAVVNLSDTTPQTITVRAVDDTLSEGLHTSLISHAITATEDPLNYPLSLALPGLTVTVLDNDLAPFVRQANLGSLIATSDNNTGWVASPSQPVDLSLFLTAGQSLAASARTSDGALLSLTLVGQAGPFTAPSVGASAVLPATTITTTGNYVLRVSANASANFTLQAILNAVVESPDTANGSELSLDPSALNVSNTATRWAALGTATPTSQPLVWNTSNNPSLFINIAGTGTALNLPDDGVGFINTRVGNSIFPAGSVSVSNNGVVAAGIVQQISFENGRLPTNQFGTALVPFWDDLDATSGNVYWEQRTVGGIETLIVQWDNRPHYSGSGPVGAATIQVQLFASGPVLARYVYPDVDFGNGFFNSGASATIGYQSSPSSALSYSFNTPLIVNGTVLELRSPVIPDVDEFEVDLSPYVGRTVDVILTGIGADFSQQVLQVLGPDEITVLANGTPQPLGSRATNLDLAIIDFVVPAPGIYTVRVTSGLSGNYGLLVAPATTIDIEPNAAATTGGLRSLNSTRRALGHLSASTDPALSDSEDRYQITLAAGESISLSTRTPFDLAASTPRNDLDPRLSILASDGVTELVSSLNTASDGKNTGLSFTAPAAGTYTVRVAATSGAGEYLLLVDEPVRISQVIVNSTTWHPSFQDYIDGGLNDGRAEGFRVPNGSVTSIPWVHVNQVKLPFNAEVGASLSVNDFVLSGRFGYDSRFVPGAVPTIEAVDWDEATKIATLRLSGSLGPNLVEVTALANGITSADGVPLASNQSFSFFVLPGDASDDHLNAFGMYSVDGADSIYIRDRLAGQLIDLPGTHPLDGAYFGYDPRADINGDGFTNGIDRIWVRENLTYFIIVLPELNAVGSLASDPSSGSNSTPPISRGTSHAPGGGPSHDTQRRVRPVVSRFIGSRVVQLSPAAPVAAPLITRALRFLVPRAAAQPTRPSDPVTHTISTESHLTPPLTPP